MPWLEVGTMFLSFALEEGLRHERIESSLPWRLAGVKIVQMRFMLVTIKIEVGRETCLNLNLIEILIRHSD